MTDKLTIERETNGRLERLVWSSAPMDEMWWEEPVTTQDIIAVLEGLGAEKLTSHPGTRKLWLEPGTYLVWGPL